MLFGLVFGRVAEHLGTPPASLVEQRGAPLELAFE